MKSYVYMIALVSLVGFASHSQGQTVVLTGATNGLYDTGVNSTGADAGFNVTDSHYTLTNLLAIATTVKDNQIASGWVANQDTGTPSARWISLTSNGGVSQLLGDYNYRLTLTNIPANQVVTVNGSVAADNLLNIFANGNITPVFTLNNGTSDFSQLNSFTLTFNSASSGTDTLDFLVTNSGIISPTGLQVFNISGSYSPVPEPREWAMIILLGFGGLVLTRKLRSRFVSISLTA